MRGAETQQDVLFSYLAIEDRIPMAHPLRAMRALVNPMLAAMSDRFAGMYSDMGRPSIPPEHLIRAMLLQKLYTIRSERQLVEHLEFNLLYRWFVGLNPDDRVWDATTFTKNRDRMRDAHVADGFFQEVQQLADAMGLLSHEHFTVDGTLLDASASHKSFRPKHDPSPPPSDGDPSNPTVDFHGEKRSNATHQSTTDPEARLAKKSAGTEAKMRYLGSVLMDNRHGLIVATDVRAPGYHAERDAGVEMVTTLEPAGTDLSPRRTCGGDKAYDEALFVAGLRATNTTPHVAQNIHQTRSTSAIDGRTTRHPGYAVSARKRKLVEQGFGWGKTIGGLRKLLVRGQAKVAETFTDTFTAYNLVRLRSLLGPALYG
jgi:transposase